MGKFAYVYFKNYTKDYALMIYLIFTFPIETFKFKENDYQIFLLYANFYTKITCKQS